MNYYLIHIVDFDYIHDCYYDVNDYTDDGVAVYDYDYDDYIDSLY